MHSTWMPWPRPWRTAALAALAGSLSVAGCGGSDRNPPTAPAPPPASRVVYTAIGASDAGGIGASVPCVPLLPCPDGTGYVPVLARALARTRQVQTANLGIPGAVLSPEIQQLGNQYGRGIPANFLQASLPLVPREATLVTIFAGGNDTNAVGAAVQGGAGGADPAAFIDQQVAGFRRAYESLVRGVRDRAPGARIVALNLPNMAALGYAAGLGHAQQQLLQRIAVGFTREGINPLTAQGVIVVDLLCDARAYDPANYSSDGFHPNDRGYAFMAELLQRAVESGTPAPVASECPAAGR